jgi:Putative MetA-pathway of phenol degradation
MTTWRIDMTRSTLVTLSAVLLLLPASTASAARIDITPAISLDQVYDSNVFNTNGNEKGDFIFRATPALTLSFKMPETTMNLRTSLTYDRYYKYTELNSANSAITLALDSQPPIALSPRFSIGPSAHFVQARNSYLRTQLVPTADPLAPPSIASESATQKSRDYGAALRANYLLTEKTEFSLGGGYSKLQFLDNTTANVGSRVINGDTSLRYKFTPLFSSGLFFNTSYNTFENGTDSRVFAGGLTGTYRFSPAFTVDARAGASHVKETSTTGVPDTKKTSPYGALSLVYFDNNFRAALSGTMEQAGGGNLGVTTRRETISLSVSDQFATRWWADLIGIYQVNRPLEADVSGDLTSATGTAGIRHKPLEWLEVHLSGSGFRQSGDGALGSDLTRYSALLGVTLGKSYNVY